MNKAVRSQHFSASIFRHLSAYYKRIKLSKAWASSSLLHG